MLNIKKIVKLQMCRPETRKNNHAVYDSKRSIFYNSTDEVGFQCVGFTSRENNLKSLNPLKNDWDENVAAYVSIFNIEK